MKKNSLIFAFVFLLFFSSCSSTDYWKLKIEIPDSARLPLDEYEELVITHFLIKKQAEDFSLNKELIDYLAYEFEQKLSKKTSVQEVSLDDEEIFENAEFWRKLSLDTEGALLFTGTISYAEETRKALLKKEKRRFDDPFPQTQTLAKRTFYTLLMDVYFIDKKTGETIYKRNFKETRSYKNPNQTAYFAFFDLIQSVRDKLFDAIIGGERLQQRYLISK